MSYDNDYFPIVGIHARLIVRLSSCNVCATCYTHALLCKSDAGCKRAKMVQDNPAISGYWPAKSWIVSTVKLILLVQSFSRLPQLVAYDTHHIAVFIAGCSVRAFKGRIFVHACLCKRSSIHTAGSTFHSSATSELSATSHFHTTASRKPVHVQVQRLSRQMQQHSRIWLSGTTCSKTRCCLFWHTSTAVCACTQQDIALKYKLQQDSTLTVTLVLTVCACVQAQHLLRQTQQHSRTWLASTTFSKTQAECYIGL